MRLGRRSGAAAVAAAVLLAAGAAGAACAKPGERLAFDLRVVQTELMVAALSCGERAAYNGFVKKFGGDLAAGGTAMRSYFRRAYGSAGEARLTSHVTALANRAALRRVEPGVDFCSQAVSVLRTTATLPPGKLHRLFETVARPPADEAIANCEAADAALPASLKAR